MSEHTIEIPSFPTTVEEFISIRNDLAQTPEGGGAMMALALAVYARDQDLGHQCMIATVDTSILTDGTVYKGKALHRRYQQAVRERIGGRPYVGFSYIQGTSPEGRYELPAPPLKIQVRHQDRDKGAMGEGKAKVFVHSTGADSPRPVHLERNNRGIWKATNYGSLEVGCRPPAKEVVDDDI
jgi:hypothetical protein